MRLMNMKKNNKEIKEMLLKAHALSDEELERVAGGRQTTFYDARCMNCGNVVRGAGLDLFTEESAQNKKAQYDTEGCPNCGMTNMMEVIEYTIDW